MKNNLFLSFCLLLVAGVVYSNHVFVSYFNRPEIYISQMSDLKEKVAREKFKHELTTNEFLEFRQYVATLLPTAIEKKGQGEASYQLRSLASVVQTHKSESLIEMKSRLLFEKGKSLFREKNYVESNKVFAKLLKDHPYSAHVPESMFFAVEGYFHSQEFDQVIAIVNKMVDVYPELEITGYALLRAGKVYELQDRHDEAILFYETVLRTFPQRAIAGTAESALRAVQL